MTIMFDAIPSDLLLTVPSAVMWSVWRSGCYLAEGKSVRFQKSKAASSDQKGDITGTYQRIQKHRSIKGPGRVWGILIMADQRAIHGTQKMTRQLYEWKNEGYYEALNTSDIQ